MAIPVNSADHMDPQVDMHTTFANHSESKNSSKRMLYFTVGGIHLATFNHSVLYIIPGIISVCVSLCVCGVCDVCNLTHSNRHKVDFSA